MTVTPLAPVAPAGRCIRARGDVSVIDVHSHYVPSGWPSLEELCGSSGWPWLKITSERDAVIMIRDEEFRRIGDDCWNADVRLADMDAEGVDVQVVSPTPVFFSYGRPAREAVKVARVFNDLALEICAPGKGRLLPFCQVPLQDADLACAELDRCLASGHVGVEIGNHLGDQDLDDEGVIQFLTHCASVGAPVFVHPWDMSGSPRLDRWMGQWLVGMPAETHLSLLAMMLGGVFDRVPDTLRIAFAHGGGNTAMWLGRATNAWHQRQDVVRGRSELPPANYVGRFFVDTVVFDPRVLHMLLAVLGRDRVMLGSDYPYPLGERPVGAVVAAADLDEETRLAVVGGNAATWLGRAGTVRR
jgi:aminocarboxymuconate-semialdehyde decarboxylase